jgi:hypothetical protein
MTVKDGKAVGYHTATGIKPMRYELIKSSGEQIEDEWFVPTPEPPESEYY